MQGSKDKMQKLIGEMSHFDPDNMEMGAKALTELIVANEINLEADEKAADAVREAFMKQMESENYQVHAHAIKCLADIVPKLPGNQVEIIFQRILKFITDVHLEENKRERYGVCAGTVIHQSSKEYGEKLSGLFIQSIKKLLEFKDQKTEIQIILISIISEFVKKWPSIAAHPPKQTYDRKGLVLYLLKNIQTKSKLEIIKKSEYCLGKLALILHKDVLDVLLNDKGYGLIVFIKANLGKFQTTQLKNIRNGILCLSQILRTHNSELRYWSREITSDILLRIIHEYKSHDELDHIDLICDILDASLVSLSFCLRTYSRELTDLLDKPVNPFNDFIEELINYNVEGMMTYAGEPMEVQYDQEYGGDEYIEEADSDQKCWKVRRSTIHYVSFLIKKDKYFRENVNKGTNFIELLGKKLIQENSMVSEMAFFTFNNIIESISVDKQNTNIEEDIEELSLQRVRSTESDLAINIISELNSKIKIVLNNSKFNDQLKTQASKILFRIVQFHRDELSQSHSMKLVISLLSNIAEEEKKLTIVEAKNYLLLTLRELITDSIEFSQYNNIIPLFIDLASKNNIKLQSSSFKCIRAILKKFPRQLAKSEHFGKVIEVIKKKLKEHDSDKIVKVSVLKCVGPLLQNYSTTLSVNDLKDILESVSSKLKIEIQKAYILDQISKISSHYQPNKELIPIFSQILEQTSDHLGSANYELNSKAIEATGKLIQILGKNLTSKTAQQILEKSKILFIESKIPPYTSNLIEQFPNLIGPYTQLIVKSTESHYITRLINKNILKINDCLIILKSIDKPDKYRKISKILGKIGTKEEDLAKSVDATLWGKTCLGALGYIGNEGNAVQFFLQIIKTEQNDDLKYEAASALGNVASRHQSTLIPLIMSEADASKDDYVFIFAIREMLNLTERPFNDLSKLIEWLFLKSENKYEGESNYYIISECIGKIALTSEEAANRILVNATSKSENRRFVLANSLRFGLENRHGMEFEYLQRYIQTVMHMIGDQQISVKEGATKSLSSIANGYFKSIKNHRTLEFWRNIRQNMLIDKSQIVIIDYGISKEKKDLGKTLRLQTYNLLQILIRRVGIDPSLTQDFIAASLDQIVEQSSTDIVLKRLNVVKHLIEPDYSAFIRFQDEFIKKIGFKEGILKSYQGLKGKEVEDERAEIYLKGVLKEILEINSYAEKENVEQIGALLSEIKTIPALANVIEGLEKAKK